MKILFAPRPPQVIREQVTALLGDEHSIVFISEDAPEFLDELRTSEVLFGVPMKRLDAAFLANAGSLRFIQQLRKGVDKVDLPAMKERGVQVATIGDLTAPFVAEHTVAMIMALGRDLFAQNALVNEGRWTDAKPWQKKHGLVDSVPYAQCSGVHGRTLGLLGMGNIGTRVGKLAQALGMNVQATTRGTPGETRDGIDLVSLDTLLETSDYLSVHLTLTPETANILDARRFSQMRPQSFLINTARGQLVDEEALVAALDSGQLAGAALDTLRAEPPAADHPLLHRSDVILSPHSGWLSPQSWQTVLSFGVENIGRFVEGAPLTFQAV